MGPSGSTPPKQILTTSCLVSTMSVNLCCCSRAVSRSVCLTQLKEAPPIDVLWFRLSRRAGDPEEPTGYIGGGRFVVLINRGDYWQVGYVLPKGADQRVRAAGLESFRRSIGEAVPEVADRTGEIED